MLFRMKFPIDFETKAQLLNHRLGKVGMCLMLAVGEDEHQTLTTQRLFRHDTKGGDRFA